MYILGVLLVAAGILSCDKLIYDNLEECPRGVYINVFAQTECAATPSYPSVKRLHIYAFNDKNVFTGSEIFDDVTLSADKECLMPVATPGHYSFVVWGGINEHYTLENLVPGTTTKTEVLLRLKQDAGNAQDISGTQLFAGSTPLVRVGLEEDMFVHTRANIREITNRIHVTVTDIETPQDFTIALSAGNAVYNAQGDILKNDRVNYPTTVRFPTATSLSADYTTLRLESGHDNTLVVRNLNTGKEIFREDLVGVILLSPSSDNINLRCLNDFHVKLKMRKCDCPETYMAAELWINDWLVHSYDLVIE